MPHEYLDPVSVHNALSPTITKLELLSRLSPLLDTDREYAECLGTIIDMMSDYIVRLRHTLDALVCAGGSAEGGRS
jgi:hypothetical protein